MRAYDTGETDYREYLGTLPAEMGSTEDDPVQLVVYNHESNTVHHARIDEEHERIVPDIEPEGKLDPKEAVGRFVERLGEGTGWDSLSSFAEHHLEGEETAEQSS